MVLTYNYQDLQNIKEKMKKENVKSDEDIYFAISACKDTLNFMFKNKLAKDLTKEDLQQELQDFYKSKITKNYVINSNDIKLKK